jgi:hypothetical protein
MRRHHHQLLPYADDVNISGGNMHTTKKNTEALVVAIKENGLALNAEKIRYMVMSRDQRARRNHNRKTVNKYVGRVGYSNIWERP